MISKKQFLQFVNHNWPKSIAAEWDPTGLQFYRIPKIIDHVLLTLDLTPSVLETAVNQNIKLILCHHPFFFNGMDAVRSNPYQKKILDKIVQHKIAVYALHTNFDGSFYGLNSIMLKDLDCHYICGVNNSTIAKWGVLDKPYHAEALLAKIKKTFPMADITYILPPDLKNYEFKTIAICSGAGGVTLKALASTSEVLVTGEAKWGDELYSTYNNKFLIMIGHHCEQLFVPYLAEVLKKQFQDRLKITESETNNLKKTFLTASQPASVELE